MSDHPSNANPSAPHRAAAVILVPERHRNHNPPSSPAGCLPHPGNANAGAASPNSALLPREYRKGNWTLHETLVLIAAKRLDDERRSRGGATESKPTVHQNHSQQNCRSAEQRWKWVENYCWNHQCFRSQNQCNDKWDNLLRDYKKVRDYEARRCPSSSSDKPDDKKGSGDDVASSYWTMEKHERKERNLPSNLVQEVFEALTDVLSRRNANKTSVSNAIILTPRPPPLAVTPAAAHESLQPIATPAAPPPPPPLQQQEPHRQPSISGNLPPQNSPLQCHIIQRQISPFCSFPFPRWDLVKNSNKIWQKCSFSLSRLFYESRGG